MANFLNISGFQLSSPIPQVSVKNLQHQISIFRNSNHILEDWNESPPWMKNIIYICLIVFFCILYIIYKFYIYYRRKRSIRDTLYSYEKKEGKNIYYSNPNVLFQDPKSIYFSEREHILYGNHVYNDRTIRMWIRIDKNNFEETTLTEPKKIWSDENSLFTLSMDRHANRFYFKINQFQGVIDDIPINQWFQITIRVSIGICDFYLDGELINTWSILNGFQMQPISFLNSYHYAVLPKNKANDFNNKNGYNGQIGFFQMIPEAWSPQQIQKQYLNEKPEFIIWNQTYLIQNIKNKKMSCVPKPKQIISK